MAHDVVNRKTLELQAAASFSYSAWLNISAYTEKKFKRLKKGELITFARAINISVRRVRRHRHHVRRHRHHVRLLQSHPQRTGRSLRHPPRTGNYSRDSCLMDYGLVDYSLVDCNTLVAYMSLKPRLPPDCSADQRH